MKSRGNVFAVFVSTLSLLIASPGVAQQDAPSTLATNADSAEPDAWYPRTRTGPAGTLVVNAPQIDSWDGFQTLTGWIAFQVTLAGSDSASYGSLQITATTVIDLEEREILLHEPHIRSFRSSGYQRYGNRQQLGGGRSGGRSRRGRR
jgi:hypothetical protein